MTYKRNRLVQLQVVMLQNVEKGEMQGTTHNLHENLAIVCINGNTWLQQLFPQKCVFVSTTFVIASHMVLTFILASD